MRVPLKDFLEKLGVRRILSPYETHPWFHYEEEQGITCSAEVRMGPRGDLLEAEIQFVHDDEDEGEDGETGPQQKMYMQAKSVGGDTWSPSLLTVQGEDFVNKLPEWEEKGCSFFKACIQAIQMGELPDIEELQKNELKDDSFGGRGGRGKIGRKSPKVKPNQLLGMGKKGM